MSRPRHLGMTSRILSIGLALALILSACAPPVPAETPVPAPERTAVPTPSPEETAAAPTPVSTLGVAPDALRGIEVVVWHALEGPAGELFDRQVAEFNRQNPWGVTVRSRLFRSYNELDEQVDLTMSTLEQPGLVIALPEQIMAWDLQGQVVELTPYLVDAFWGYSEAELADFPAVYLDQDRAGDRQLGMPAQRSSRFLFYNQSWARELGFSSAPSRAGEFETQACAANLSFRTDADALNDGFGGWVVDGDPQTALSWLYAFGGSAGPDSEAGYAFQSNENRKALEYVKGLYDRNCAWLTLTGTSRYDVFAARKALFVSGTLSDIPAQSRAMVAAANSDEWTLIPYPGDQGIGQVVYGPSYTLLESVQIEQVAAWLFVRWMLEPERQPAWVEASGLLPLRASAFAELESYRRSHPQWEAAASLIPQGQVIPRRPSWRVVKFVLGDAFWSLFRMNRPLEDIPAVLEEIDLTAQELSQ